MKNILACFVLVSALFSCNSKSHKEKEPDDIVAINRLIADYNLAFEKKDWNTVLGFIHPAVFNYMSKKDFEKDLESTFKGDGYEIRIVKTIVDSIYPVIRHESGKYSLVRMKNTSLFMLAAGSDSADINKETLAKVCDGMEEEFAEEFISCQTVNSGVEVTINDLCYAVFLPAKRKWFFLSKDEDSEEIVNNIIPAEVRSKLRY